MSDYYNSPEGDGTEGLGGGSNRRSYKKRGLKKSTNTKNLKHFYLTHVKSQKQQGGTCSGYSYQAGGKHAKSRKHRKRSHRRKTHHRR
jgi:hypothetical protein